MLTINNLEEMAKYYNEATNTYIFIENGELAHIELCFDLSIESNIQAKDIKAKHNGVIISSYNIKAYNIKACNILSGDITAWNIRAENIKAWYISAGDITARDIKAWDIKAGEIYARDIKANDIKAKDIKAKDIYADDIRASAIKAQNIDYYNVCYANNSIDCSSIKGRRTNSKHFCLDGEIRIREIGENFRISIDNIEEMAKYYNEATNTYIFVEDGKLADIEISFHLSIESNIKANDIKANDIKTRDITAQDIKAYDIKASNIKAWDIDAWDIKAKDITAGDINAGNISAWDIDAWDIKAKDIFADDIKAKDIFADDIRGSAIKAQNIDYVGVCYAHDSIDCTTIKGRRENSKHYCLDGKITIGKKERDSTAAKLDEDELEG